MTYDEARSILLDRIDQHPKDGSVDDIISDLELGSLATEAADGYSRRRSQILSGLRDTAEVHLYESTEPSISDSEIRDRQTGLLPELFPSEDTETDQHLYWLVRWTHFRTATIFGQEYYTGAPAVKVDKESGEVELGVMLRGSSGGTTFRSLSESLSRDSGQVDTFLRQSRESYEESPTMHSNVDVLCDGWDRLLDTLRQQG